MAIRYHIDTKETTWTMPAEVAIANANSNANANADDKNNSDAVIDDINNELEKVRQENKRLQERLETEKAAATVSSIRYECS